MRLVKGLGSCGARPGDMVGEVGSLREWRRCWVLRVKEERWIDSGE